MPLWGNVDTQAAKPKFPVERQTELKQVTATVAQASANGNSSNTITVGGLSTVAAQVSVGTLVVGNNITTGTTVSSFDTANGIVYLSANTTANVQVGDVISFSSPIAYHSNTYETTYNADTILVSPTRMANANVAIGDTNTGWVHVRKKVNNDGTVRYLKETLVALANPVASNTASGATSNTVVFTGL
jgi:hypothetical protein